MTTTIRLTEYSHGSGCGCKISPKVLDVILRSSLPSVSDPALLVGNDSRDDAAVYDLGNGMAVVSTTDFFMPIVDDPYDFGRVAATNAISDIYAMGGRPVMAVAIFGWPLDKLPAEVGQRVVEGGRAVCRQAGIALAGGHSIDAPEPIFGLAVTGVVASARVKRNNAARAGDRLFLTKPIGIGILTTAQKKKRLKPEHAAVALETMCRLNDIGSALGEFDEVHAMTDVTGFGLAGHLRELCEGSGLRARLDFDAVPLLPGVRDYLRQGCSPGGAQRNFDSYAQALGALDDEQRALLCDPQTSGGLLVALGEAGIADFQTLCEARGLALAPIGTLVEERGDGATIELI